MPAKHRASWATARGRRASGDEEVQKLDLEERRCPSAVSLHSCWRAHVDGRSSSACRPRLSCAAITRYTQRSRPYITGPAGIVISPSSHRSTSRHRLLPAEGGGEPCAVLVPTPRGSGELRSSSSKHMLSHGVLFGSRQHTIFFAFVCCFPAIVFVVVKVDKKPMGRVVLVLTTPSL